MLIGNNPQSIGIIITSLFSEKQTLLSWDVAANNETMIKEVAAPYDVVWDPRGNMFIIENGKVTDARRNCTVKAY